jgi:hypothetical protein
MINELGERIPKHCMSHDQSFPGPLGKSFNYRVIKEALPPCMYSFVRIRSIHYIVSLILKYPRSNIFICKFDLDAAYHWHHLSVTTATKCLTIHDNILLMALRMTFGGSPCPSLWGYISGTIADTCNTLIHNSLWNHNTLYDSLSTSLD